MPIIHMSNNKQGTMNIYDLKKLQNIYIYENCTFKVVQVVLVHNVIILYMYIIRKSDSYMWKANTQKSTNEKTLDC